MLELDEEDYIRMLCIMLKQNVLNSVDAISYYHRINDLYHRDLVKLHIRKLFIDRVLGDWGNRYL